MASREVQITDLLSRASGGDNTAQMTIVIEPRSTGELIIEAEDLTNWSRTTPVYFTTFKADESSPNGVMEGSQTNWKGIVNPDNNSIHSLIADTDTPDQGNDIGDYILVLPTARQFNDLHEALSRSFNPDGSLIEGLIGQNNLVDGAVTASKIDFSTIGILYGGGPISAGTNTKTLIPSFTGLLQVEAHGRRNSGSSGDLVLTISATGVSGSRTSPGVGSGSADGFASSMYYAKVTAGISVTITIAAEGGAVSNGGYTFSITHGAPSIV